MKLPDIPKNLEDWDISIINELVKYPGIESESFDFKRKPSELYEDICAMANTIGGFIVLGIDQIMSNDSKKIIRFEKVGFENGTQDNISNNIGNNRSNIEPLPVVHLRHIPDHDSERFYTVVKVDSKITGKPYFFKGTDQCFVRLQGSSRRVGRTTILNLYGSSVEQRKNVENLKATAYLLKEALLHTSDSVSSAGSAIPEKIAPVDLFFIKNIATSTSWFLTENSLLGMHTREGGYTVGLTSNLNKLEELNADIFSYNTASDQKTKELMKRRLDSWNRGGSNVRSVTEFLEQIEAKTTEFLSKF